MSQSGQQQGLSIFDQQVLRLEAKVNQLQASLTHWQQWYFDYSALKEEVDNVIIPKDDAEDRLQEHEKDNQRRELARIRRDFESDLLTKKEINELFGKNDLKSAEVISGLIGRRIDYVERNLDSLKKLIETEEGKLARANIVAHPDAAVDEETGLPITDIVEQLDEDDNVLRYQLRSGGDAEPAVVEALKKLGIEDIPMAEADAEEKEEQTGQGEEEMLEKGVEAKTEVGENLKSAASGKDADSPGQSLSRKKSVSFADDTKPGHQESQPPISPAAQRLEEIMKMAKEQEAMDMSKSVIPENESAEDAQLRRQMIEYSMSEIGPVVAELEIDNDTGDDDDEGWDDDFEDSDEDYDDDEDDLGRSQSSVITDDYIKRMQELEKRLGFQSHFTITKPEQENQTPDGKVGRIAVMPDATPTTAETVKTAETKVPSTAGPKAKKGVRFASQLDIADEKNAAPSPKPKLRRVDPVGEIVEKVDAVSISDEEVDEAPKRVSRFKKERKAVAKSPAATTTPVLPKGPHQLPASFLNQVVESNPTPPQPESLAPEDKIMADVVIERNPTTAPKDPSEIDDELLYQAAAVEYNRLRNKMIQKEGGFMKKEPEREIIPLDEEEGGPPKMSRFKAARLGKS